MRSAGRGRVSQIASTIAAAIEQQGAVTREISRNVQRAAKGTAQVAASIAEVNRGAGDTGTASSQILTSAQLLSEQSARLRGAMEKFLATVRPRSIGLHRRGPRCRGAGLGGYDRIVFPKPSIRDRCLDCASSTKSLTSPAIPAASISSGRVVLLTAGNRVRMTGMCRIPLRKLQ